ncbi:MAG: acetyltransferase [Candidatus Nitronauta litoralis]|uniref:Acetyltransferase n=1 Tax=Candidatus Nitronauta litoralis TaxID=2705533 RepID=A0A7T0BZB6_9BACT|nr:MAG: acetyltransferase [Candidatus Nitronauta litoralis]
MQKLYGVYGANGAGRGVLPIARENLKAAGEDEISRLVFIDDHPKAEEINNTPILTYEQFIASPEPDKSVSIAIADSEIREKLVNKCSQDSLKFFSIRAENAVVMDSVEIGEGAIVSPFVTFTSNIKIGKHFHANLYSYVEHDCIVGDFVTFAPGVQCNGNIVIEDHAYIGAGAVIRQGKPGQPMTIGKGAVIGMGAVVTKSVATGTTVAGCPAKPIS